MSANIKIILDEALDVLVVPNPALADNDNGEKIVKLLKDGQRVDQAVETGITDEMNTVILSGLKE